MSSKFDISEKKRPSTTAAVGRLLLNSVGLVLWTIAAVILWPLYWVGTMIWHRPPNLPRTAQVVRYLRLTWTVQPPSPGIPFFKRCWITILIIQKVMRIPFWGLAWLIDELLYGRELNATPVTAPLIEISAGRSGSTQIARYLEMDPHLAAPNILQAIFPYLWLWRLVPVTIGRFFTPDKVREKIFSMMTPEFLERHEADPFKTDTFDGALYNAHLNALSPQLGPEVMIDEFGFGSFPPHNQRLWEEDFVNILDRIGRKTILYAGPNPDGSPKRFFVKGHFLCAADALEKKYPDASFLTIIREPVSRLRSAINYLRVNPADPILGPVPWEWLAEALVQTEIEYCEVEQAWFTRSGGANRCVIRFSDFVTDLEGAMTKVYRDCFGRDSLPPHVPKRHPPRNRKNYLVNRSLEELDIDETALRQRLASYIDWCQGEHMSTT